MISSRRGQGDSSTSSAGDSVLRNVHRRVGTDELGDALVEWPDLRLKVRRVRLSDPIVQDVLLGDRPEVVHPVLKNGRQPRLDLLRAFDQAQARPHLANDGALIGPRSPVVVRRHETQVGPFEIGPMADHGAEEGAAADALDHAGPHLPRETGDVFAVARQCLSEGLPVLFPGLGGGGRAAALVERRILAEQLLDS